MDIVLLGTGFCSLIFLLAALYFYLAFREAWLNLARKLTAIVEDDRQESGTKPLGTRQRSIMQLLQFQPRHLGWLGSRLLFPHTLQQLESRLELSGLAGRIDTSQFLGLKMLLASFGLFAGILSLLAGLPFAEFGLLLLPIAGFFWPVIWLNNLIRKRQEALYLAVPDFMDLLAITLQAGISLDQALRQAAGIFPNPLREEIQRLNRELELGVDKETAWNRLLARNPVPELHKIAKTVLQGASLGVPIAEAFRVQAEDGRRLRMEHCKQKAAKASPKITLVTTLVMAPSVFIMILGLLLLNVFYNPQGLGIEGLFK